MQINILHFIKGAKQAKGLTVIIDVFRAFSVACYAMHNNPKHIIPIGNIDDAYQLKQQVPNSILIGERNEILPEGFDFCNSPTQILDQDFKGKTLIHTTTAGTQGIINARNANEIITGSMVNAAAIARYIQKRAPKEVSLVCMGYRASEPSDEDTFCAAYIRALLKGKAYAPNSKIPILKSGAGARFFTPETQAMSPASDFDLCLDFNRFNFVLRAQKLASHIELVKIDM